ncbi:MAG: translation initiation factor IF-3 [Patescibacteria group bacterium]
MFKKYFSPIQNKANERIKAPEVRVLDETGKQLGVMPIAQALALARQAGLDLVEITANANPPVCKIIDLGKFLYQKEKKAKEQSKGRRVEVKNIRLSFNIAQHDLAMKAKQAKKFLLAGNRARIQIVLRGREKAFAPLARQKLANFTTFIDLPIVIDQPIVKEPRGFYMLISKGK